MMARPPLSSPNDEYMPAFGNSSGADRFMRSNKTTQADKDPCQ